ncbi:MAG: hypothetical protein ACXWX5_09970 [Actinomycetota bacterium]
MGVAGSNPVVRSTLDQRKRCRITALSCVLGAVLHRVRWFRISVDGLEADLTAVRDEVRRVEEKVDQLLTVALPMIDNTAKVFPSTIIQGDSEDAS